MNISMQLAVVAAVCLCLVEGAPDVRVARAKQQRPTRGFKNVEMMTARGFGKRDRPTPRAEQFNYGSQDLKVLTPEFPLFVEEGVDKRDGLLDDDKESYLGPKKFNFTGPLATAIEFGKRQINNNDDGESYFGPKKFRSPGSMRTANGYGKRQINNNDDGESYFGPKKFSYTGPLATAKDYGKRQINNNDDGVYGLDNFWEMLEASPEREGQDANDEKALESIPLDWFVNEMLNNPDFTRSVVRKFVDLNQDGQLTSDELLRNVV